MSIDVNGTVTKDGTLTIRIPRTDFSFSVALLDVLDEESCDKLDAALAEHEKAVKSDVMKVASFGPSKSVTFGGGQ